MTPAEYAATEARFKISEVEHLKGAISIADLNQLIMVHYFALLIDFIIL